jgi:hypothetical protein
MKKWIIPFALAAAGLAVVPEPGEACFRRRHQPACVVVVAPGPMYAPQYAPPGYPQYGPGVTPVAPVVTPTVTIKGKTYRLLATVDQGAFEEHVKPEEKGVAAGTTSADTFHGSDRKDPKTTIVADAKVEEFASVSALVKDITTKHPDADMKESSGITKDTMTRVGAEKRNVKVKGYIHAFKKESDNDYHVILGDAPDVTPPVYLNVEVSGIPVGGAAANRKQLVAVRNEFKAQFGLSARGPNRYQRPSDPIPVQITGSLFWDVDHPPGAVGTGELKPKSAWEIHPVSEIVFLDP